MTPEEQARVRIDQLLTDAGWTIQDYKQINLGAALGIALCGNIPSSLAMLTTC